LYGNDMDGTTTPIEASLEFAVDLEKGDFIGRAMMARQTKNGISRKLIGFELLQRGVPRHGHPILSDGKEIGVVSSGNHSPTLNRGIGMGYVRTTFAEVGGKILIDIRGNTVPAVIVERPFYKKHKA
jgi:aminomethyltransferase